MNKEEKILIFLKFITVGIIISFILICTASIFKYKENNIFISLLILFIIIIISIFLLYKVKVHSHSIIDTEEIEEKEENGIIYKKVKINSSLINDYQNAIISLKEKNEYIIGRYNLLYAKLKNYNKEMQKVRKLQESMIMKKKLNNSFISSDFLYIPLDVIGGDFFDYIKLNKEGSRILFVIADIAGHGVDAGIITSMFKVAFRNLASSYKNIKSLMYDINEYLIDVFPPNYYLTMILAEIDIINKKITYSNASHTPLLIQKSNQIIECSKGGTIVGLFPKAYYEEESIELAANDSILFFTDGVIEASRSKNKYDIYGINRLKNIFNKSKNLDVHHQLENIKKDFYEYLSYRTPDDDFTICIFKIKK